MAVDLMHVSEIPITRAPDEQAMWLQQMHENVKELQQPAKRQRTR